MGHWVWSASENDLHELPVGAGERYALAPGISVLVERVPVRYRIGEAPQERVYVIAPTREAVLALARESHPDAVAELAELCPARRQRPSRRERTRRLRAGLLRSSRTDITPQMYRMLAHVVEGTYAARYRNKTGGWQGRQGETPDFTFFGLLARQLIAGTPDYPFVTEAGRNAYTAWQEELDA